MQVVIDIPEEMYQKIKETSMIISGRRSGRTIDYTLFNAVINGKSLPKGHGRLIDVDMLEGKVEKHRKMFKISRYDRDLVLHYTDIEMAPTIIEADKGE